MFCSECGHKNRNDSRFCSECGKPLKDYTKKTPKEDLLIPEDIKTQKEFVQKRNDALKKCSTIFYCLLVAGILLTIISFLTKDTVQLVIVSIATACFLGIIITTSISHKIKKRTTPKAPKK